MNTEFCEYVFDFIDRYDNSRIRNIRDCLRKGFWMLVLDGGYADFVGPGAHFGSCMHAAAAASVQLRNEPFQTRLIAALQAFGREYEHLAPPDGWDSPRDFANGLSLVKDYLEHWEIDYGLFSPVEPEMAFEYLVEPEEGDPEEFKLPFIFEGRMDELIRINSTGQLALREMKNVSDPNKELNAMRVARQVKGYVYVANRALALHTDERINIVLADIVQVAAKKREFKRDYIIVNALDLYHWRRQLILDVLEWRKLIVEYIDTKDIDLFRQSESSCTNYGLCSFHNVCWKGIGELQGRQKNSWSPVKGN